MAEPGEIDWEALNNFHRENLKKFNEIGCEISVHMYTKARQKVGDFILKQTFPSNIGTASTSSGGVTLECKTTRNEKLYGGVRYSWMQPYDYSIYRDYEIRLYLGDCGYATRQDHYKMSYRYQNIYKGIAGGGSLPLYDIDDNPAENIPLVFQKDYLELVGEYALSSKFQSWLTNYAQWGESQMESVVPEYNLNEPIFRNNIESFFVFKADITLFEGFTNLLFATNDSTVTIVNASRSGKTFIIDAGSYVSRN